MNINFKISNQQFIYILIIIILLSLLFSCNNSSIMEGITGGVDYNTINNALSSNYFPFEIDGLTPMTTFDDNNPGIMYNFRLLNQHGVNIPFTIEYDTSGDNFIYYDSVTNDASGTILNTDGTKVQITNFSFGRTNSTVFTGDISDSGNIIIWKDGTNKKMFWVSQNKINTRVFDHLTDIFSLCNFPEGASFALTSGDGTNYLSDMNDPNYQVTFNELFSYSTSQSEKTKQQTRFNYILDKAAGFRIDFDKGIIYGQQINDNIPTSPKPVLYWTCDAGDVDDFSSLLKTIKQNNQLSVNTIKHGFMRKSLLEKYFTLYPMSSLLQISSGAAAASGGGGGAAAASGGGSAAAASGGGGAAAASGGGGAAAASGGGGAAASGGGSASSATGGSATNQNAINVNVDSSVSGGVTGNPSTTSLTPGSTTNIINPLPGQTFNNPALLLQQPGNSLLTTSQPSFTDNLTTGWNSLFGGGGSSSSLTMNNLTDLNANGLTPSTMFTTSDGRQGIATTQNTINGIPSSQIPQGQEDLYILKSQVVPPVCPACPPVIVDKNTLNQDCPPCPPCARCPEPSFECKKVPNFNLGPQNTFLPRPVLNDFSTFGM